ncbi:MAG: hypothetical protein Q9181_003695 [Wetmoreana brouardii]
MSTAPSKPLDFTAQIGVMGKGNCKPKCPPHVTVPFPAVFYKWDGGAGRTQSRVDDEPSPYVGHIDLQQLPTPGESKKTRRGRSKSPPADANDFTHMQKLAGPVDASTTAYPQNQKKRRRTSPAPASPPGGYRIPQKGQLQIVIKNPNKTAVKLFLVPYDLEDMEAGTKTFIRQRCYSTDPIIDGLTTRPKSELIPSTHGDLTKNKPTLRYLIHVNICSPSTGRYYLYQHIRVVFANRVPDNKEQLQTEIQVPQPRYSAYNAGLFLSRSVSNSSSKVARDKAYRRRSSGFVVGHEGMDERHLQSFGNGSNYPFLFGSPPPPVPGIPFHLSSTKSADRDQMDVMYGIAGNKDCSASGGEATPFPMHRGPPASLTPPFPFQRLSVARQRPKEDFGAMDIDDSYSRPTTSSSQSLQSPLSDKTSRYHLLKRTSNSSSENGAYNKLNRGEAGYGGQRSPTPEPGQGLLARKLRGLGMQRELRAETEENGY